MAGCSNLHLYIMVDAMVTCTKAEAFSVACKVIYTTACASENSGDGTFLPLTVSYSERFSSAGRVR